MYIIRTRSPMRISFAGGGTDFPTWYLYQTGHVLSATINKYAYCTLVPNNTNKVNIISGTGANTTITINEPYKSTSVLDLAKAAVCQFRYKEGFDLYIDSDVLPGSGLGGSSALTSAIISAVADFAGTTLDIEHKAALNYKIEREIVGIPGGKQDQYATTFGGCNHIQFLPDGRVIVEPLCLPLSTMQDLEAHMIFCYTGAVRTDLSLIQHQLDTRHTVDAKTGTRNICKIALQLKEALLFGELDRVGELLHEGYVNKKLMNSKLTNGTNADALYQIAVQAGCTGGKLCGAGGGGYLALYVPTEHQFKVKQELKNAGAVIDSIAFEHKGEQIWRSKSK